MKLMILTCIGMLLSLSLWAQTSFEMWEQESKRNKRLLPRYGHLFKTPEELRSDSDYVRNILALPEFKSRREASNHMINLGFRYYYREDIKTAMYRFNQAYLIDSTNADIFWGYGAVYMALGQYDLAKKQYEEGLSIDSTNTHLITDLATWHMGQYYLIQQMPANDIVKDPQAQARVFLDSAIMYLQKSFRLNPSDVNTAYKLSICYWNISDCTNAWRFYDAAFALGGKPITENYTRDLKKRCKRKD